MYREGVESDFSMLRHVYSLTKKKGELAFSFAAMPSINIFARLKALPKTWRHMFFVVEHPSDFCDVRCLWVDECHKIRRPKLSSVYLELVNELHEEYLAKRTSASNCSGRYIQKLYNRSRVVDGESCSFQGIFLLLFFFHL